MANIIDSLHDTEISLPEWVHIVDLNKKNTKQSGGNNFSETSSFMPPNMKQSGGNNEFSETSSFMPPNMKQSGGNNFSETSSFMPPNMKQSGGNNFSETSSFMPPNMKQSGGNNFSETSSFMPPNMKQSGGNNFSETSSFMPPNMKQSGGNNEFSVTSSYMPPNMKQSGGNNEFSVTSSFMPPNMKQSGGNEKKQVNYNEDISKLIDMLTTSESNHNDTAMLENKLQNILSNNTLSGGNSNNVNVNNIKSFFIDLKKKGVDVNVKLNNKTMSEFFNTNTTTENVSDMFLNRQDGGKDQKENFFFSFKKIVADKLNISNGPIAGKIAGMINKKMKEKNEGIVGEKLMDLCESHLNKNIEEYKNMYKSLVKKK